MIIQLKYTSSLSHKKICVLKLYCTQMIAQSIALVHLSLLSQKLVALLNVGQVIFMLDLFLNIRCW